MGFIAQIVMVSFVGCMLEHATGACNENGESTQIYNESGDPRGPLVPTAFPNPLYANGDVNASAPRCDTYGCDEISDTYFGSYFGSTGKFFGYSAPEVCASGFCIGTDTSRLTKVIPRCGTLGPWGSGCSNDTDCEGVGVENGVDPQLARVDAVCDTSVGQCKIPANGSCSFWQPQCVPTTDSFALDLCMSGRCAGTLENGAVRTMSCAASMDVVGFELNTCATPAPTAVPTPAPTSASISGDPIAKVNGYKVKFELPVDHSSLLWQDDDLKLFAKVDVVTPDRSSQWFSDFILFYHRSKAVHIQQKALHEATKGAANELNTLSLLLYGYGKERHDIAVGGPGSYEIGNGSVKVSLQRDGRKVGPFAREVVSLRSKSIDFSVASQSAVKFKGDAGKALKYAHLDINVQRMDSVSVRNGIFAEMWGLIPMSAKTARMISHVQV